MDSKRDVSAKADRNPARKTLERVLNRKSGERDMSIIEITDFKDPALDPYARLSENQLLNRADPENAMFLAESPKVVERALDAGYEPLSMLMEKKHIEGEGKNLIERAGEIPVYTADFDLLTQLTGFKLTRGMLCLMRRKRLPSAEAICRNARRIAILEDVVNPTNVGAIFRSAAALGMDAVLLTKASSNPLYRRAIRVSMGTVFQIPWTFLEDWPKDLEMLKGLGFKSVAMALKEDSLSIDDPILLEEEKLAIVLGTEGDGLAAETIGNCDYTVMIPMAHHVDSLNVAAASALAFWELGKKKS